MSNLSLSNTSSGVTQAIPLASGSVVPTAAVTGPMPVLINSSVSTPLVGNTALIVPLLLRLYPLLRWRQYRQVVRFQLFHLDRGNPDGWHHCFSSAFIYCVIIVGWHEYIIVTSVIITASVSAYQPLVVVNTPT